MKVSDGSTQYIGDRTISIEINQYMSHDDFISIVCGAQVKIEFIVKFDPSSLILLYDDSSFMRMLTYNETLSCICFFIWRY